MDEYDCGTDMELSVDTEDFSADSSETADVEFAPLEDGDIERIDDIQDAELEDLPEFAPLETASSSLEDTAQSEADVPPTLSDAFNDPELFDQYTEGEYSYTESESGKNAFGSLELTDDPVRNPAAQRTVGGENRHPDDDGGHLIGARFGGEGGCENLDAQNSNLNRSSYKRLENEWADSLEDGDRIFANVETYKGESTDRPEAYMGYTITEHPDASRDWDAFSFQNESAATQDEWNRELEDMAPPEDDIPNAMEDADYAEVQRIANEDAL